MTASAALQPVSNPEWFHSFAFTSSLVGKEGYFVSLTAANLIVVTPNVGNSGGRDVLHNVIGVVHTVDYWDSTASEGRATVRLLAPKAYAIATDPIAPGTAIAPEAGGKAKAWATTQTFCGIALTGATADGDQIEFMPGGGFQFGA